MRITRIFFAALVAVFIGVCQGNCASSFTYSGTWSQRLQHNSYDDFNGPLSSATTTLSANLPMKIDSVDANSSLYIWFSPSSGLPASENAPSLAELRFGALWEDSSWRAGKNSATLVYVDDSDSGASKTVLRLSWTKTTLTINLSANKGLDGVSDLFLASNDSGKAAFFGSYVMNVQFGYDTSYQPVTYSHVIDLKGANSGTASGDIILNSGNFSASADFSCPTVKVNPPTKNAEVPHEESLTFTGTAKGKNGIADVQYNDWSPTDSWNWMSCGSENLTNWSFTVQSPLPGVRTIYFRAVDTKGNVSAVVTNQFVVPVTNRLILDIHAVGGSVNPLGTVSGITNGQGFAAGQTYIATAKPVAGAIFCYWRIYAGEDDTFATYIAGPALKWEHPGYAEEGGAGEVPITIQAVFASNPWPELKGNYTGLFYDTWWMEEPEVDINNCGSISVNVTGKGAFSGKLTMMNGTYPFSGQFVYLEDVSGPKAEGYVALPSANKMVWLMISQSNGIPTLSGEVGSPTSGAAISGYLVGSAVRTNDWAASYTFYMSDFFDSDKRELAWGYGYGTASILKNGTASMSLVMPDKSTAITFSPTFLRMDNPRIPVFQRLYGNKGFVLGWADFSVSEDNPADRLISSEYITWYKPPGMANQTAYVEGFKATGRLFGTCYEKSCISAATTGSLTLSGGSISADWEFTPTRGFTFANLVNCSQVSLKLTPTTGVLTGSVTLTAEDGKKKLPISGVAVTYDAAGAVFRGFSIVDDSSIEMEMMLAEPEQ